MGTKYSTSNKKYRYDAHSSILARGTIVLCLATVEKLKSNNGTIKIDLVKLYYSSKS